jgi:hypothetical protein
MPILGTSSGFLYPFPQFCAQTYPWFTVLNYAVIIPSLNSSPSKLPTTSENFILTHIHGISIGSTMFYLPESEIVSETHSITMFTVSTRVCNDNTWWLWFMRVGLLSSTPCMSFHKCGPQSSQPPVGHRYRYRHKHTHTHTHTHTHIFLKNISPRHHRQIKVKNVSTDCTQNSYFSC